MARKKIIAGNWKMNMTPSQAVELVNTLKPLVVNDEVDVVFCVPAIDLVPVMEATKGTNIQVGAENMYFEDKGCIHRRDRSGYAYRYRCKVCHHRTFREKRVLCRDR